MALRSTGSTRGARTRHPTVYQRSSLLSQYVGPGDVPCLCRDGGEHLRPMHNVHCTAEKPVETGVVPGYVRARHRR